MGNLPPSKTAIQRPLSAGGATKRDCPSRMADVLVICRLPVSACSAASGGCGARHRRHAAFAAVATPCEATPSIQRLLSCLFIFWRFDNTCPARMDLEALAIAAFSPLLLSKGCVSRAAQPCIIYEGEASTHAPCMMHSKWLEPFLMAVFTPHMASDAA